MRILHTESSRGWGGQEMRILQEALGLRKRGHEIFFAVNQGGKLIKKARDHGFVVYELAFCKGSGLITLFKLLKILKRHSIDIVNTHSSLDAWISGIAARIAGKRIIRTRHLSTAISKGLNSYLLYNKLVDFVVTTSSCIIPVITSQAKLDKSHLKCIPTGIDPNAFEMDSKEVQNFRTSLGLKQDDILVGTACFVRSWKGIGTLLAAAQLLKDNKRIKWVVVGGGHVDDYRPLLKTMHLEDSVIFTGHLERPYPAIAAMDIFLLLSTAHEGVSQASLQAAYLERPLITTSIGGLPEVCIDGKTGIIVAPFSAEQTAHAVNALSANAQLRCAMGKRAKALVEERFTLQQTLDGMEAVCEAVLNNSFKRLS